MMCAEVGNDVFETLLFGHGLKVHAKIAKISRKDRKVTVCFVLAKNVKAIRNEFPFFADFA